MFKLILIIPVFVVGFIYTIFAVFYKIETVNEQAISFKQYLRISAVCPEKWEIIDGLYFYVYYNSNDGYTKLYMKTYFDQLRLGMLYKRKERKDINDIMAKERAKLIKQWQRDINSYQDRYMEQVGVYYQDQSRSGG